MKAIYDINNFIKEVILPLLKEHKLSINQYHILLSSWAQNDWDDVEDKILKFLDIECKITHTDLPYVQTMHRISFEVSSITHKPITIKKGCNKCQSIW